MTNASHNTTGNFSQIHIKTIKSHVRFPTLKCLIFINAKEKNKMNWLEKILKNEQLCNNLSSFLDQYEAPDLAEALQLYRITHQTYE